MSVFTDKMRRNVVFDADSALGISVVISIVYITSRDSDVVRASDCRSEDPEFESWSRHFFFCLYFDISFFSLCFSFFHAHFVF